MNFIINDYSFAALFQQVLVCAWTFSGSVLCPVHTFEFQEFQEFLPGYYSLTLLKTKQHELYYRISIINNIIHQL
jgi:predicted metal-binding protein